MERETANFARQLTSATLEKEIVHVLNEHNCKIDLINSRNELRKAKQMQSFKDKLGEKLKKKRNTNIQEVFLLKL